MSTSIASAPYRFVPLSGKIVSPYWKDAVSHDVPFSDGLSGHIEYTLTNYTPLFVGDGTKKNGVFQFCQHNGKLFIPGTSVKGMIRNILEIMSFGNFISSVQDEHYASRDLYDEGYINEFRRSQVFCGYLYQEDGTYKINNHGTAGRICQTEIDRKFGTNMAEYFDKGVNFKDDEVKSAKHKYDNYSDVVDRSFQFVEMHEEYKTVLEFDEDGPISGKIVFTGQSGSNKLSDHNVSRKGKHFEFVFYDNDNPTVLPVSEHVMKMFKSAYFDSDEKRWSIDWDWRREQLKKGEKIPVFFMLDGKNVKHLGLSYMYKLPYKYGIHDIIKNTQSEEKTDLAQVMFGHIQKNNALKGRISFSSLWQATKHGNSDRQVNKILSSPKSSYYPFYLQQKNGLIDTYSSENAKIAGWKRYPIREKADANTIEEPTPNENVIVKFSPLPEEQQFTGKIYFHNLKKVELGMLVSSLTLHEHPNAFHSLGMGKPFGFGKVKATLNDLKISRNEAAPDVQSLLIEAENYMDKELGGSGKWLSSDQIRSLFTYLTEADESVPLEYMSLKDHDTVKEKKEFLKNYHPDFNELPTYHTTPKERKKYNDFYEADREKILNNLYEAFYEKQKEELEKLFEARKQELLIQVEKRRLEIVEEFKAKKRKAIKEAGLEKFLSHREQFLLEGHTYLSEGDKFLSEGGKPITKLNDFKNAVYQYGEAIHHPTKRKVFNTNFNDGFITKEEDIAAIKNWVRKYSNRSRGNRKATNKRPLEKNKVYNVISMLIGIKQATQFLNELTNND